MRKSTVVVMVALLAGGIAACGNDQGSAGSGGIAGGAGYGGSGGSGGSGGNAGSGGTGGQASPVDVTISGTGFTPHDGHPMRAVLVASGSDTVIGAEKSAVVTGGAFSITWPASATPGTAYRVAYFVGLSNDDDVCQAPPADHVWLSTFTPTASAHELQVSHNTNFTPSACDLFPAPAKVDVIFSGTGFTPHEGHTMHAVMVADGSDTVIGAEKSAVVTSGAFSIDWPASANAGTAYRIAYFVGLSNDDDVCLPPPADHEWLSTFTPTVSEHELQVTHNTNFTPAACDLFTPPAKVDLTISGTGFTPHDGHTMRAALVAGDSDTVIGAEKSAVVTGGAFSITWPASATPGTAYRVAYFVGLSNDDEVCQAPPADHVWLENFTPTATEGTLAVTHNTNFTPSACDFFPPPAKIDLTISGTGFTPHEGHTMHALLLEEATDTVVGEEKSDVVTGGSFSISWPASATPAVPYRVAYFVGLSNDDDVCQAPPADHVWLEHFTPTTEQGTLAVTHNTNFTPSACTLFSPQQKVDITLSGTGFTPHEGHTMHAVVVEDGTDTVVGAAMSTAVYDGSFSFTWPGVATPGTAYRVAYFVGLSNDDGICQAPPADHVWLETFTPTLDSQELDVTHNTNFTPSACSLF